MRWFPLKSEANYIKACLRVDEIIDRHDTDELANELLLLSYLIEDYEAENFPQQ